MRSCSPRQQKELPVSMILVKIWIHHPLFLMGQWLWDPHLPSGSLLLQLTWSRPKYKTVWYSQPYHELAMCLFLTPTLLLHLIGTPQHGSPFPRWWRSCRATMSGSQQRGLSSGGGGGSFSHLGVRKHAELETMPAEAHALRCLGAFLRAG